MCKANKYTCEGVHKVLLQFKKFITKAIDEISYIDLFYINQCLLKFFVSAEIFMCLINVLINLCKMATPQEKA